MGAKNISHYHRETKEGTRTTSASGGVQVYPIVFRHSHEGGGKTHNHPDTHGYTRTNDGTSKW